MKGATEGCPTTNVSTSNASILDGVLQRSNHQASSIADGVLYEKVPVCSEQTFCKFMRSVTSNLGIAKSGQLVGLIGPNGTGKTSFVDAIN